MNRRAIAGHFGDLTEESAVCPTKVPSKYGIRGGGATGPILKLLRFLSARRALGLYGLAPAIKLRQLGTGSVAPDGALADIDGAIVAVNRDPVTLAEDYVSEMGLPFEGVDVERVAADDTWFAHLARHEGRMRCASPACGHNSGPRSMYPAGPR
jgi:hypothetical protein